MKTKTAKVRQENDVENDAINGSNTLKNLSSRLVSLPPVSTFPSDALVCDVIVFSHAEPDEEEEAQQKLTDFLRNTTVKQPKVVPPRETKAQLYADASVFADFDRRAIQVCTCLYMCVCG